jgi:hypothetical protein
VRNPYRPGTIGFPQRGEDDKNQQYRLQQEMEIKKVSVPLIHLPQAVSQSLKVDDNHESLDRENGDREYFHPEVIGEISFVEE